MIARFEAWYLTYGPRVLAGFMMGAVGVAVLHGDWLMALVFLTLAIFLWQYERTVDAAYQRGWTGACSVYDTQVAEIPLDVARRLELYGTVMSARPDRRRFRVSMDMARELAALPEDAAPAEFVAIYEKYHRG